MHYFSSKPKNEKGIALLLSMMVLSAIIGLVFVSSDVSFSILRSNQSVGLSEAALFAAESAVEITLYDIVANNHGLDLVDLSGQGMAGTNATWSRRVRVATSTPGLCGAPQPKHACSISNTSITNSNPLYITLDDQESFQMDFDIESASYPNHIRINLGSSGSRLVVIANGQQTQYSSGNVQLPATGIIDPVDEMTIRLINESGSTQIYTLEPQPGGSTELPMGLAITGIGDFLSTQRTIQVIRPAWLIY